MSSQSVDRNIKTLVLNTGDVLTKRQEIKNYFNTTFSLYESLFECLNSDKSFFQQPESLRHPLIFYFGHTATFFINKFVLARIIKDKDRINKNFESTFAVGVDEMSWDDLNKDHYVWPTVQAVKDYRNKVRDLVNKVIDNVFLNIPIQWNDPFWIIIMGIEHELIHLETSSVLLRQLDLEYIKENPDWPICEFVNQLAPVNSLI
jgi:hypothetical protein